MDPAKRTGAGSQHHRQIPERTPDPAIEDLFYQLIEKLIEFGEVSYRNVFADGAKIEANANKYTFVWAKAVEKNLRKLTAKAAKEVERVAAVYGLQNDLTLEACI